MTASTTHWPQRELTPTDILVGPCAWHASLLQRDGAIDHIREHPSLIVIDPMFDDAALRNLAPALRELADCPILLGVTEPTFARHFNDTVQRKLDELGRHCAQVLMLWVDDAAELKSGGILQQMFTLREQGRVHHLGLMHHDVRSAEWLALNTAARVLAMSYGLSDQSARYRAIPTAADYGMAAIAFDPLIHDERSLGFSLGDAQRVLPVLRNFPSPTVRAMTPQELDVCWEHYQQAHQPPAPLPRSHPPMESP